MLYHSKEIGEGYIKEIEFLNHRQVPEVLKSQYRRHSLTDSMSAFSNGFGPTLDPSSPRITFLLVSWTSCSSSTLAIVLRIRTRSRIISRSLNYYTILVGIFDYRQPTLLKHLTGCAWERREDFGKAEKHFTHHHIIRSFADLKANADQTKNIVRKPKTKAKLVPRGIYAD
jgi:hypothetical protein